MKHDIAHQKDFIRSKCIEANPSIKDLVFGCNVKSKHDDFNCNVLGKVFNSKSALYSIYNPKSGSIYKSSLIMGWEIIGRDTRLADVLHVLHNSKGSYGINDWGEFLELSGYEEYHYHIHWNLLKDSLDDQTPETIEFIYNLIK